jgi:hypothetical protein
MKKYNGIFFDRVIATSLVYATCDHGRNFQPNCPECIIKNQFKSVAYLQPHRFEVVLPPWLFNDIFRSHGVFPVSTKGVISLYLASAYELDVLFDQNAKPVDGTTKTWMKLAAPHRKRGQVLWESTRELFMANLKAAKSALEFIQVQERRIWEGMGICMHISKQEPEGGWKKWVDDQVEKYGSRQLVKWTFHRCLADETDPRVTELEADNKHKLELIEYDKQYHSKQAPVEPAPVEETKEDDVDEEEEDTTAQDQEHIKKFLEAVDRAEQDMSGATKKKRKNRKKKKKATADALPLEPAALLGSSE